MCNEAARRLALGLVRGDFNDLRIKLRFPEGAPNMEPLASVRITDPSVIVRAAPDHDGTDQGDDYQADLVTRRWSWPGPGGKPVYNYRSDNREFRNGATQGRCLIPFDGFYEFTDPPAPPPGAPKPKRKDKWYFAHARDPFLCVAGLWRAHPDVGEAWTMLTTEPGPDVAPYHSRQIVIVDRADWRGWLDGSAPAAAVCRPAPAGTLTVARV